MTQFGRSSNTLVEIMRAAAVSALAISKVQDFDAIYIAVMNPEEYTGGANIASHVAEALGFRGIPAVRVETASSAGAAAVHVAYHGVAEGLSRLRELHQRLKLAYRGKNLEQYFEANRQFPLFIAQMSRNGRLYQLISEMRRELRKTRLLALQLAQRTDYSMRDQILDAFLKRNPHLAESTVLKHLANQLTAVKKYCNRLRPQGTRSFEEFKKSSAVKFSRTFRSIVFFGGVS